MDTTTIGLSDVWFVLWGNSNLRALGLINVDETIKKINNRNTMSVMDDMLKFGLILLLRLIAMTGNLKFRIIFSNA